MRTEAKLIVRLDVTQHSTVKRLINDKLATLRDDPGADAAILESYYNSLLEDMDVTQEVPVFLEPGSRYPDGSDALVKPPMNRLPFTSPPSTATFPGKSVTLNKNGQPRKQYDLRTVEPWYGPAIAMLAAGDHTKTVFEALCDDWTGLNSEYQVRSLKGKAKKYIRELQALPEGSARFNYLQKHFKLGVK